jgi:hypothetical protein
MGGQVHVDLFQIGGVNVHRSFPRSGRLRFAHLAVVVWGW